MYNITVCVNMFNNLLISVVIIIFALSVTTIQQEMDPEFLKNLLAIRESCAQKYGFTVDYVIGILKSPAPLPNDDKLKCYFSCTNLKLGVIDDTGDVKEDVLKMVANELFSDNVEADIVKNCDVPKEGDLCATAFKLMQCVHKESFD